MSDDDHKALYDDASLVVEAAIRASNAHEGNLLVLGMAAQLLMAFLLERIGIERIADFRRDLNTALGDGPGDFAQWREVGALLLPDLSLNDLAGHICMGAVTRARSARDAQVALAAAFLKLTDAMPGDTALSVDEVKEVASTINVRAIHMPAAPKGEPN